MRYSNLLNQVSQANYPETTQEKTTQDELIAASLNQARFLFNQKKLEPARTELRNVLQLDPENFEAQTYLNKIEDELTKMADVRVDANKKTQSKRKDKGKESDPVTRNPPTILEWGC